MSRKQKRGLARIGAGAVLLAAAWLLPLEGWASLAAFAVPYAVVGWDVLWKAVRNILHGQVFDENFLMALATVGAFATGEYSEGVAVMLFYQIGEWFQRYAVGRSRKSITALMDIRPDHANLVGPDGTAQEVDPDEVSVGSTILVKPGERVPLDGTVLDGDSDFRRCLKPSALFRYVEQVSADHARAYGMDHAFFRERRSAFLVGKQALRVWRMPGRAEKINLTTACEVFKKGTMKRLTTITSETGEKLALVDCRWMIVDTEAGRILRTPGWTMPDFQNDDLPEELPQIVHKSQPLTAAGERRASYSMCDLNGHINNSLYLDIACDALPQEVVEVAPLSFASIKYHREVPMGQTVQVFYAPSGNGWYLLGRREEHAAFECYLEFGGSVTESLQK